MVKKDIDVKDNVDLTENTADLTGHGPLKLNEEAMVDEEVQIMMTKSVFERVLYNKEKMGHWTRIGRGITSVLTILIGIWVLSWPLNGTLPAWEHRAVFTALMLILTYSYYPFSKKLTNIPLKLLIDGIPLLLSWGVLIYCFANYPDIEYRAGNPNQWDLIVGSIVILLVIEGVRRTTGWAMAVVAIFFLGYIFAGPYFPGLLAHRGFRFEKMIDVMFTSTSGIFSEPTYVMATVIIMFTLFGAFLLRSGIGKFFIDAAYAVCGRLAGGPALVAVCSSALFGMVTGNGPANCTICGSFTIPLMKKVGYSPEFAGAVEATASQGGQIMPPIMGAGAFVMAEYTGVPYIQIAAMAAIPATLYFVAAGTTVYLEALKTGLKGLPASELPSLWQVIKEGWFMVLPLVTIIYMMIAGFSPMKAGFYAIIMCVLCAAVRKATRMSLLDIIGCLEKGVRNGVSVAMCCASAGIIVGSIVCTGLGIRFSRLAIEVSGGELLPLAFMVMIASLILGMGMPTVAAYIILSVLAVPAFTKVGVYLVAAHLFVFYFGIISGLTPPVAITAYTSAGIAESNPGKTGVIASRIAIAGFLVPYIFIYNNALLLKGSVLEIVVSTIVAYVGLLGLAAGLEGYLVNHLHIIERAFLIVCGVAVIFPETISTIIGVGGLAAIIVWKTIQKKALKSKTVGA